MTLEDQSAGNGWELPKATFFNLFHVAQVGVVLLGEHLVWPCLQHPSILHSEDQTILALPPHAAVKSALRHVLSRGRRTNDIKCWRPSGLTTLAGLSL